MSSERERAELLRRLADLENAAELAHSGASAGFLNQAGDVCVQLGDIRRALEFYGMAIDAHVKADRFTPAMAICRKMLRVEPHTVRARCTLAWLAIGSGFEGDACGLVDTYVGAARRAGRERLAMSQLRWMADTASREELCTLVAHLLEDLGDQTTAEHAYERAADVKRGHGHVPDAAERWSAARRAALQRLTDAHR